jgi:glycosyltransferase involved in cell wall biosynthesis
VAPVPNRISLIIPIFNEGAHLTEVLTGIDALELPSPLEKELILIDDASTDDSWRILSGFPFKSLKQLHQHPKNRGKGAALRTGIAAATGSFIGIQDADFEYSIEDVPALLVPLLQGKADVVYGSRFKKSGTQVHRTFHYLVNRFLTSMSNFCSGLYLTDMETCYKFFRSEIIQNMNLETHRFGFEPEVTAKIAKLKIRVHELPISYFPRNYLEGKKITWKDGVAAIFHILTFNYLRSLRDSFKTDLPGKYVPRGGNWL